MSLIDSGPVLDASCEGVAASGEPEVEAVFALEEGFCSRERSAESTGSVSMESGVSPSGRLKREAGGGVAWLGDVAIFQERRGNSRLDVQQRLSQGEPVL